MASQDQDTPENNDSTPQPPLPPVPPAPGDTPLPAPAPKPRRRRRWPWVIVAIVILIIILILLTPTIVSTGPVKSYVVSKINDHLNGKLTLNNLSVGWFSGVDLKGVKVDDADGREVVEVNEVRVPMSLFSAIGGNYKLGDTLIDSPNLVIFDIYPDGTNTLSRLIKEQPGAKKTATKKTKSASKLPDVSGKVTIKDARGTVTVIPKPGEAQIPPLFLDPSTIVVDIPNINAPISDDGKLVYRVGSSSKQGMIQFSGSVDAVENNQLVTGASSDLKQGKLPEKFKADQKIEIAGADVAPIGAFLKQAGKQLKLAGTADGAIQLKADGAANQLLADGQLHIAGFSATGGALKEDIYKSSSVALPIDVTTAQQNGSTVLQIKTLKLQTVQFDASLAGNLPQKALGNLADHQKPGASGNLTAIINATDLPGLINPLRDLFNIQKDVQVTGGKFANRIDLAITPDSVALKQSLDAAASGTRAGRPIQLEPIHLDSALTALPTGQRLPELRDLALNLTSAFATAKGGGQSIADLNLDGNFDLKKAQDQLAQFVDLGQMNLAGTGTFKIASQGDLASAGGTSNISANVTLSNVAVQGLKGGTGLDQPRLVLDAKATLKRAAEASSEPAAAQSATQPGFIQSIPDASLTFQSGPANAPVVDVAASAKNIIPADKSIGNFDISKLSIPDLAKAQQSFSAVIPGSVRPSGGSLLASISGSYAGDTLKFEQKAQVRGLALQKIENGTPRELLSNENEDIASAGTIVRSSASGSAQDAATTATFTSLSATSSNNLFDVKKVGDQPLVVVMKNDAVGGNGELTLSSNLKRVMDALRAMGQSAPRAANAPGQLTSGQLDATLKLASSEKGANINLDGTINGLGVTTSAQPIQNEKVTIALAATTPPDFKSVNVSSAAIGSSFAKATLSDMLVKLGAPPLEMIQSAKAQVAIPDLNKTYAVMQALTPAKTPPAQSKAAPTTQPLPPLEIGGGAVVNLDLKRDPSGSVLHLNIPEIAASKVSIIRGQRKFAFDKLIKLAMSADVQTTKSNNSAATQPDEKIDQIRVTQLEGDLGGLAALAMPQPIAITNLTTGNPAANGKISINGSIEPLTRVLSVLQNADPMPYRGDYAIAQSIATTTGQIKLAGDATINKLIVLGSDGKPAFSEDKLVLADDLSANPDQQSATINNIALTMPSSQAAGIALKGQIADYNTQRTLKDTTLKLSYDLQKLWPMVKPLLSPQTQDQLKDLKIAGKFDRTFDISGSYPADPPDGTKPIKYLKADGSLAVALLDTSGINVQDLELPISLENGQVVTVYANKPKAQRTAPPAKFNGGTLDLNSMVINLNGAEPRLSIGKNQQLVKGASINSLLGNTLGKYINPVFTGSQRAKGLLDVTIDSCENVALGQALKSNDSGNAKIIFSLTDMDIANPVGQLMLAPIINGISNLVGATGTGEEAQVFQGYVKNGTITLAHGKTTQDVTLELIDRGSAAPAAGGQAAGGQAAGAAASGDQAVQPQPGQPAPTANSANVVYMPLSFNGDVDLATQALALNLRVPPQLVSKFIPDRDLKKQFDEAFPQGIPGVIHGTTAKPKFDYGNVVAEAVKAIAQRQILKSIPGLNGNNNSNGNNNNNNPLGGLLNQITGQNNNNQQQSPPPKKKHH